jgi:asparagine synthetase B (glutamine-hydrolysing)
MKPTRAGLCAFTISLFFSVSVARAAGPYPVTFERNALLKLRDGVTLRADIYRPQAEGQFPVLLQRTPYDKNNGTTFGLKAAARGVLPAEIVDCPKRSFDMPMAPMLQRGPVAAFLDEMLLSSPRCGALFSDKAIAAMVRDLREGADELWKVVWMVLAMEVWMRVFRVEA